jgi:1-acyl-sn-glycerol-3-phosphate acyltransferase
MMTAMATPETSSAPQTPQERLGRPIEPTAPPLHPVSVFARLVIVAAVMLPVSIVYWVFCAFALPWRKLRIQGGNAYGKVVGRSVQRLMGIVPEIHHFERRDASRPAIYLMNHTATIDMWVGMWLCPWSGCGMAKKEIVRVPIFGQAYWLSGHLLLDRGNRDKAIASMNKVQTLVEKHQLSMWIWPEGTRSRSGRLKRFKKGFVHAALATGLPIVPCVAHNAHLYWPGGGFKVRPGRLQMEILPPIPTTHWSADRVDEHIDEVMAAFASVLSESQHQDPAEASAPRPELGAPA